MYPKSVPLYCKGTFFYYLCTQQLINSIIMKVTKRQVQKHQLSQSQKDIREGNL